MTNTKAVLLNFDPPWNVNPPDGYLLSFQASTGLWVPVLVPLGINRVIHSTITFPASPYAVQIPDDFIPVDSTGGPITINLPAVPLPGKGYTIADIAGQAGVNAITVSGNGHNIGGTGSVVMNLNYQNMTVLFNGVNWTNLV